MYGQQVGILTKPLDNLMIEELKDRDNTTYFTICVDSLEATIPLASDIAKICGETKNIGPLFVEDLINPHDAFSFDMPFEEYINVVSSLGPGKTKAGTYTFMKADIAPSGQGVIRHGLYCSARNSNRMNRLWYMMTTNREVEWMFSVSYLKTIGHPLSSKLSSQGVMGYSFKGSSDVVEILKHKIIDTVREHEFEGVLTLNQIAFVKEFLTEIEYQSSKRYKK